METLIPVQPEREQVPEWLTSLSAGSGFPLAQFFSSRVVFYPGSGFDGHPVQFFAQRHWAHCFVYVDYGLDECDIVNELAPDGAPFHGYRSIARFRFREQDLTPHGWVQHLGPNEVAGARNPPIQVAQPFCLVEILERKEMFGEGHGPARLAILFLGADAVATFDALWCQDARVITPWAVVLQDHGFGGNYTRFGAGGLLHRLAERRSRWPGYLLVARNTNVWPGYVSVPDAVGRGGGMHGHVRQLYERAGQN